MVFRGIVRNFTLLDVSMVKDMLYGALDSTGKDWMHEDRGNSTSFPNDSTSWDGFPCFWMLSNSTSWWDNSASWLGFSPVLWTPKELEELLDVLDELGNMDGWPWPLALTLTMVDHVGLLRIWRVELHTKELFMIRELAELTVGAWTYSATVHWGESPYHTNGFKAPRSTHFMKCGTLVDVVLCGMLVGYMLGVC